MKNLIEKALDAQMFSYAPYSQFQVGAALLSSDGRIFTGCNIENIAFSPTICAERTAFFNAISQGVKDFTAIALVGNKKDATVGEYCTPCGVCLQVMSEFCNADTFEIILIKSKEDTKRYLLRDMLPFAFQTKM